MRKCKRTHSNQNFASLYFITMKVKKGLVAEATERKFISMASKISFESHINRCFDAVGNAIPNSSCNF